MSGLLPFEFPVSWSGEKPLLAAIDDEEAGEVIDALSSDTARTLLTRLYEEPAPASALADHTDTSIQNVRYHLEKLTDAGLVEVADTWYSERGREMPVYAPTREGVVLFAGRDRERTLRKVLSELLGAIGIVGVLVAAFSMIRRNGLLGTSGSSSAGGSGGRATSSSSGASGSGTTQTAVQTTRAQTTHAGTTHAATTVEPAARTSTHLTTTASHAGGVPLAAWLWLLVAVIAIVLGYYLLTSR